MKSTKNLVSTLLLFSAVTTILFTQPYAFAQKQEVPTTEELATLLTTANSPLEHHRIAMYYRQEASQARRDAETHRAWANIYGKGQGAAHCRNLAKVYEQAAKHDDALAIMHEKMGNEGETKH